MSGFISSPYILSAPPVVLPLLDAYPTALAAYSFRKLRNAYAGSAVRIRESGGNTESDIGFTGVNFNTAAAAAFIGGNSGFIVTWYDQSGNGYDMTQVTTGDQPLYVASAINSLPALRFVSSDFLKTTTQGVALLSATLSTFAVATLSTGADGFARLVSLVGQAQADDFENTFSAGILIRNASTSGISAYHNNTQLDSAAISLDTGYVFGDIFNGSNSKIYVNGVASAGTAVTDTLGNSLATLGVGRQPVAASPAFWVGYCSEVAVWASDQTANVTGIDSNIGNYWGL